MLAWRIENASRQLSSHGSQPDALSTSRNRSPPSQLNELLLRVLVIYLFGDQFEPWTVGRHSTGIPVLSRGVIQRGGDIQRSQANIAALGCKKRYQAPRA